MQQALQLLAAKAGGAKKPPSESINFKDLPPDGKAQMADQAGIKLAPDAIAAHDAAQKEPTPAKQGGQRSMLDQVPQGNG